VTTGHDRERVLTILERWVRHAAYELRDGFLVRPLAITAALGVLAVALTSIERDVPAVHALGLTLPLLVAHDATAAAAVLGSVTGSMMAIVSIVLSVLLVALTFASIQFSPRILTAFIEDRASRRTIGIFLGTFLYCLFVYPSATDPQPTPLLSLLGATALAITCLATLVSFIHHIAHSISPSFISDRIAAETERVIDEVMPEPLRTIPRNEQPPPEFSAASVVRSPRSGYVRYVDFQHLRTLHGLQTTSPQEIAVRDHEIEFRVEAWAIRSTA
jgi:uncharacterized membrane protein